jgi:hypothetical protein
MPNIELSHNNFSLDEIKAALEDNSGYPFELEIARRIESLDYFVEPNYSFEDQDTGVARELDVHAIKSKLISKRNDESAFVIILGSCKDNKNPYVFFTRELTSTGIKLSSDVPIAGCPLEIFDKNNNSYTIDEYLELYKFLHIGKTDVVSSQFCELKKKDKKWEIHSENIYKDAIIPLTKALYDEIQTCNEEHTPNLETKTVHYQIYYPLIVLNGQLLQYHVPHKGPSTLKQTQHIVIIRQYDSKTVKCLYAIDVIHESYLEEYLKIIDIESDQFISQVKHDKKIISASIKKIVGLSTTSKL